jgi:hypothetical protein
MLAFDVYLNQKKLCRAGIGDDGVLTAIATYVAGEHGHHSSLTVGGLISPKHKHVSWVRDRRLVVGDRIQIKVVEVKTVDKPARGRRIDPVEKLKAEKRFIRLKAKQFGWRIQSRAK